MRPTPVHIVGAGPAGSAAALAALSEGAAVRLFEKSRLPRHKVCGEFLSPEVALVLDRLGAWRPFQQAGPALIRRVGLHFGRREKRWNLREPAYGLSRYALDDLLAREAVRRGAALLREPAGETPAPAVLAHGRKASDARGRRLFGFKAHFRGPADDVVNLFFFSGCYAGISAVENGETNICGLAPEPLLRACDFEIEAVLDGCEPLAERIRPLARCMDWLITGPLVFRQGFRSEVPEGVYPAGDAMGFTDPFTGTGIVAALITGRLAGLAAAQRAGSRDHLRNCRRVLGFQYQAAALLRMALSTGMAQPLMHLVPGSLLFQLTRPGLFA
jgi:hypothetical protein